MGVRSGLRKFSQGADLTHPKLTPWGIVGITAAVVAILAGIAIGKYLWGKSKSVVGGVLPGGLGKEGIRGELGI